MRQLRKRTTVLLLNIFGMLHRRAQCNGDVVGDLISGDGNHGSMSNRPVCKHANVSGTTADIHQAYA